MFVSTPLEAVRGKRPLYLPFFPLLPPFQKREINTFSLVLFCRLDGLAPFFSTSGFLFLSFRRWPFLPPSSGFFLALFMTQILPLHLALLVALLIEISFFFVFGFSFTIPTL